MTTVRIDDDVAEALNKLRSVPLTREVNERLRRSLDPSYGKVRAANSSANVDRPFPPSADCRHPVGRRIGSMCGECGSVLPASAERGRR